MNQDILKLYVKVLEQQIAILDNGQGSVDKSTADLIIALQAYLKEHNLI